MSIRPLPPGSMSRPRRIAAFATRLGEGRARALRYAAVVVLGAAIDFVVALVLARGAGLPLTAAAVGGFVTALAANYLLFEFWAFRREASRFSPGRFGRTVLAAGCALAVRLAVVALLAGVLGGDIIGDALVLLCGMGASFIVNYVLVISIFRRR